jgi:hypothetical protein
MTLRNFDTELDLKATQRLTVPGATITETVTVHRQPSQATAYLGKGAEQWTWSDLRDYVVREVEKRFGLFPRDHVKEKAIFSSFMGRYPQAVEIARYLFDVCDGYWMGAPVSVFRFTKGSDPYCADKIVARLAEQ